MLQVGRVIFLVICLAAGMITAFSQPCTTLGQNPVTAFPVCGITQFTQKTVPLCTGGSVPTKGCNRLATANPYYYKFTCYISGKLGFVITPLNPQNVEDYDWQLFDITGRDPNDIYTDASLIVTGNWAGTYGPTGASATGTTNFQCGSDPPENRPTFAAMPELIKGHEYLLLVSHFLSPGFTSEIGYTLKFETSTDGSNGLASITDPNTPAVQNVYGVCDGTEMTVKLNKKVKCGSLAADGSDFSISGPVPNSIISAVGKGCSTSFDMDTVRLLLSSPMVLGTYNVTTKTGSDGNTLIDNCDVQLPAGLQNATLFTPAQPTPMDSITPPVCIKDSVQLVFRKPMLCSSIAPDGSDFIVTGPVPITVKAARGVCSDGVSTYINVSFTAPIRINGRFTVTLRNGTDGNTLIDECAEQTPAGSTIDFITKDITRADFQPEVASGCRYDTLQLRHDGNGNASQWRWMIDTTQISTSQNHTLISRAFGTYTAQLTVSNGICTDVVSRTFVLPDHTIKAVFSVADTLCPTDALQFTDQSIGNIDNWRWNFANGNIHNGRTTVPQTYPLNGRNTQYIVSLQVSNIGCTDIAYKTITVLASCYMAVPSAFTPNGDGLNDYFHPLNAFKADNMVFRVYNRFGQVLFESREWTKKWDGRYKGLPQPGGTYVWTFDYTDKSSGEKVSLKGTTVLIR